MAIPISRRGLMCGTAAALLLVLLNRILLSNITNTDEQRLEVLRFMNVTEAMDSNKGLRQASCQEATVCMVVVHNPNIDDTKFSMESSRCFDEVIYTIASAVHDMGGKSCVRYFTAANPTFHSCDDAKRKILFGFNVLKMFPTLPPVPLDYIIYNLEQVGNSPWFSGDLIKNHSVWDYSRTNIRALANLNITANYIPIGFAKGLMVVNNKDGSLTPTSHPHPQDIDVLILGVCNPRRCAVINQLTRYGLHAVIAGGGVDCANCSGSRLPPVYGSERNNLISRAKIVLNVHYFPGSLNVFEIVRVSFMMANKVFVISETGSDKLMEAEMEDGVIFAPYHDLVNVCIDYLHSPERRAVVAHKALEVISKRNMAPYLRCPLFGEVGSESVLPAVLTTKNTPVLLDLFAKQLSLSLSPRSCFRVLAIIGAFNEGDVIESTVTDLIDQGCDVHYIDNWSTDNTAAILNRLKVRYPHQLTYEVYPEAADPGQYNWKDILSRKEVLANSASADWVIHVDADELRESPWGREITLRQALFVADSLGYNLASFATLAVFRPVQGVPEYHSGEDLKRHFSYFTMGKTKQLKAWKTFKTRSCYEESQGQGQGRGQGQGQGRPVFIDLTTTGGHEAIYTTPPNRTANSVYIPEAKIFPLKFVLRHYPIRSESHGKRKVFLERKNRYNVTERKMDWHIQYDHFVENTTSFLVDRRDLERTTSRDALPAQYYSSIIPCMPQK